jgi:hypothetical protein
MQYACSNIHASTAFVPAAPQMHDAAPCSLGLVTTWSGDLWGLRKELIPWLTYHAYLGVSRLYVLYEGNDPRTLQVRAEDGGCCSGAAVARLQNPARPL